MNQTEFPGDLTTGFGTIQAAKQPDGSLVLKQDGDTVIFTKLQLSNLQVWINQGRYNMADRINDLSAKYRGKRVRVFKDPETKRQLEDIGTILAMSLREMAAPLFECRIKFHDGVFIRIVDEADII